VSPEKYDALLRDYPELLAGIRAPCECGDGWETIIRWALRMLARCRVPVAFDCIKEKFGGLRMYCHAVNGGELTESQHAILDAVVRVAEREALMTCDECGADGNPCNIHGWLATRCEAHTPKGNK
jgi:hypothetical protein